MQDKDQLSILIIEDEYLLAENLKEQLQSLGYANISHCTDGDSLQKVLSKQVPDIAFVDIHLGNGKPTGLDLLSTYESLSDAVIVVLSAFDDKQYRSQAADLHADAYLIKPATERQIDVTLDLAFRNKSKSSPSLDIGGQVCPFFSGKDYFFIKSGVKYDKITISDIVFINSDNAYIDLYFQQSKKTLAGSIKKFVELVNTSRIIQCHRSYAVNIDYVVSLDDTSIFVQHNNGVKEIPVGRTHRKNVEAFLPKIKI